MIGFVCFFQGDRHFVPKVRSRDAILGFTNKCSDSSSGTENLLTENIFLVFGLQKLTQPNDTNAKGIAL